MFLLFSSQAGVESKTTFDDLLESLKQLEEEPAGLIPVEENTEHKFGGWSKLPALQLNYRGHPTSKCF